MGEVKEAIKGSGSKKKKADPKKADWDAENLLSTSQAMADDFADLLRVKDEDVLKEGDAEKPENLRKAAVLRAVYSLQRTITNLLEEY
jgi:hypothetical protein